MREILFYQTKTGRRPVVEFLDSLPAKHAKKVTWTLRLIEELGQVPSQYFKKLVDTDDIWEVRVRIGTHSYRILGFLVNNNFILTNALKKKSAKLPQREIEIAEIRKSIHLQRNS